MLYRKKIAMSERLDETVKRWLWQAIDAISDTLDVLAIRQRHRRKTFLAKARAA